eukprot:5118555-Karenia_brevis.AAC.1
MARFCRLGQSRGKSGSELQKEATQRSILRVLRDIGRPLSARGAAPTCGAIQKARIRERHPLVAEKKREGAKRGQVAACASEDLQEEARARL